MNLYLKECLWPEGLEETRAVNGREGGKRMVDFHSEADATSRELMSEVVARLEHYLLSM